MQKVAKADWRAIAQIFNQSLLKRLAFDTEMSSLKAVAGYALSQSNLASLPLGKLLDQLYELLTINYRSEYVYKNVVAQKIAIERHVTVQARLITEFRVNQSKADAVVLNGTSTVYEIKTEYDDLARLTGQLADYKKAFDRIYVVTHGSGADKLIRMVHSSIGIIVLNDGMLLDTLREAESNLPNVDPLTIFDSLREREYLDILKSYLEFTPQGSRYDWHYQCRKMFETLSREDAHTGMLNALKARTKKSEFLDFVRELPSSMTAIGLASEISIAQQARILERLASPLI